MQARLARFADPVERRLHLVHAIGGDHRDGIAIEARGRGAAPSRIVEQAENLGRTGQAHGAS